MKFGDLLDVLESDEKLFVNVTNEWGDGFYDGTVGHFREEEELLHTLRVDRVYTCIIEDEKHSDVCANRVALIIQTNVTLYDDEHEIIYRGRSK